jgi:hypothetical protein
VSDGVWDEAPLEFELAQRGPSRRSRSPNLIA